LLLQISIQIRIISSLILKVTQSNIISRSNEYLFNLVLLRLNEYRLVMPMKIILVQAIHIILRICIYCLVYCSDVIFWDYSPIRSGKLALSLVPIINCLLLMMILGQVVLDILSVY